MKYRLKKATTNDISILKDYELKTIFEYAEQLSEEELTEINNYVETSVPTQLENYKIIFQNGNKIGCLLVQNHDDGVLLNEIYLEENYRNQGIGTDIIKEIISENDIIYLWVYKLNVKAISLYKKLGFEIIEETESRYYMKYNK